ncbi:MAG: hypothetical protein GX801_11775 [Fibrobacter sp.]|nr:hypothetical protein [Fibrobacter sp.]
MQQVHLKANGLRISGFSISGLSSYMQMPDLNLCFDMGECPLSAIGLNHIFLSHAHGDHSRCLLRHHSLRRMMNVHHDAFYYLPEEIHKDALNWIRYEAIFQGVNPEKVEFPKIFPVKPGEWHAFAHRPDLVFKGFHVKHSIPSMGFTVALHKKKLKDEYLKLNRDEIIALRKEGLEITREVYENQVSYIGDCTGESLLEQSHIWESPVVILECTFIDDDEEEMARLRQHTHLQEIIRAYKKHQNNNFEQTIVLKHFSMKYGRKYIIEKVKKELEKENLTDKFKIFL